MMSYYHRWGRSPSLWLYELPRGLAWGEPSPFSFNLPMLCMHISAQSMVAQLGESPYQRA